MERSRSYYLFLGGPFSNWYPAPFTLNGVRFATAEHAMMYAKARLFGDEEMGERILLAETPREAKRLGRMVRGFDQTVWDQRKQAIVASILRAKFLQNPPLFDALLATGERVIAEASPHDRIWGIGLVADDPRAADESQWRGENLLGSLLGSLRDEMRAFRRWHRVVSDNACAGVVTDAAGKVVDAAPIFRRWIGRDLAEVIRHHRVRSVAALPEPFDVRPDGEAALNDVAPSP